MVTCHCFIFLVRGLPAERTPTLTLDIDPHFFLPGLMSMALPALAGYRFKKGLDPYLVSGRILNLNISAIAKLLLGLILLDAVKNCILFGFIHAFKWDVLAFVVVCLLLMLYALKYVGMRGIWGLVGLNFAVILLYAWQPTYLSLSESFVRWTVDMPQFVVFTPASLILAGVFYWIWTFKYQGLQLSKVRIFSGVAFAVVIFYFTFMLQRVEPYFWASLVKLPISIFIQLGQGGGHIWPLLPWSLVVMAGFIFAYYEHLIYQKGARAFAVYFVAQLIFSGVLIWNFGAFRNAVSYEDFFSSHFFEPRWQVISLMVTFFISAMIGYHYVLKYIRVRSSFVKLYSEGILLFYFIHLFVASLTLKPAIAVFPGLSVYTLYPILVNIISYLFLAGLSPLFKKHIEVKFVKR